MIRQAVSKDIKPLAKVIKNYASTVDKEFEKNIVIETIRGGIAKENNCVFISKDDKEINGFASGTVMSNGLNNDYELVVTAIYVDEGFDQERVSKALLREVKKWGQVRYVFDCKVTQNKSQNFDFGEPISYVYKVE